MPSEGRPSPAQKVAEVVREEGPNEDRPAIRGMRLGTQKTQVEEEPAPPPSVLVNPNPPPSSNAAAKSVDTLDLSKKSMELIHREPVRASFAKPSLLQSILKEPSPNSKSKANVP